MLSLRDKSSVVFLLVLVCTPTAQAFTLLLNPISFNSWSISFTGRGYGPTPFTVSLLLANLYYMFWLACTVAILVFYFFRGEVNSTIIPCISSAWYKVYTIILTLATVILIVVVAIETQQLPCGKTPTWPLGRGPDIATFCPGFKVMDPNANTTSISYSVTT